MDVTPLPASSGGSMQATVGTTASQLSATSISAKSVTIKSDSNNTGNIYIGFDSSVSSANGFQLEPGGGVDISIDDLSKIWLIADADNQKIYVIYVY